ncbi:NepR family anti-sigma factor [Pseudorhodobacter wandonensis]|jgi:hemerythrin-like domain-containing protein|uniref:NepR family anti-sigma factor n=1 Tax=Pseudorhodobacter wandonensis TaxID=1120568 RepID=UPI00067BCBAF
MARLVPSKMAAGKKNMYGEMANDTPKDKIKQQIEENLKRVYDDALNEPVPDRFLSLLEQLRKQDSKNGGGTTS